MNFEPNTNPHLLIIEDDIRLNKLLLDVLLKNEFVVSIATNLSEAREFLEDGQFRFDIILLDYHLPDGSGDVFFEWLKITTPDIPVIFISADRDNTIIVKCFKAGAVDFIEKPFDIKNVLSVIKKTIKKSNQRVINDDINAELFTNDWIELSATSELEFLSRIQRLCSVLLKKKLEESVVDDLKLAMEEYGRNAIEWGNKFCKNKKFIINYCIFDDRVILKFEDEGDGFDLKSIPDPSKDPVEHLKYRQEAGKRPGGYGIFMMKSIMDEVLYNEKGNVCIMTKYIK